ncbi:MAG: hypothetical protein FWH28_06160 [Clostridiales bacterium]|nr:hypothetical protein [Clostridiales bacterium]
MIGHLRCFLKNKRGSLSLEAMLTLPVLLLAVFLCAGLVFSIHGLLIVEQAASDVCKDLAENSYLLQQAWGFGLNAVGDNELVQGLLENLALSDWARDSGGYILAASCLHKYLKDYPEIEACVRWRLARLPGKPLDENMDFAADPALDALFDEDDVLLILSFAPSGLNHVTKLLPDSWQILVTKRQKAWLIGRNLPPGNGAEQAAGQKDKGPLVYITRWGIKYHVDACRYLRQSKIPAYLNQLSDTYGACLVCKPPQRNQEATTSPAAAIGAVSFQDL